MITLSIARGNQRALLRVLCLVLAMLGGWSSGVSLAQGIYDKEYIRVQPRGRLIREGGSIGLEVEYALGRDASALETVYWYKDGKYVGESIPVLQTYPTLNGPRPILWNPYAEASTGDGYFDTETKVTNAGTAGLLTQALAVWRATFPIDPVTAKEAGMYRAKVGVTSSTNWNYTNFAQVALVPSNPLQSMEIVRHPSSRSLSAPNSDPIPSIGLYGDMRSHVFALLNTPFGAATDADGFVYIPDTLNHCIRRVSPGGRVTTLAGLDGEPFNDNDLTQSTEASKIGKLAFTRKERDPVSGFVQGITNQNTRDPASYRNYASISDVALLEPKFSAPEAVTVSDLGIVYVADTGNHAIRGIRTAGGVTTVFDLYGNPDSNNLRSPRGVYFAGSSADPVNDPPVLYVLDSANYSVKKLYLNDTNGELDRSKGDPDIVSPTERTGCENIAGLGQTPGWQGATVSAAEAKFYSPRGIVFTRDPATGNEVIYVADTVNHVIRQIVRVNNAWTARTVVGFVGSKGNLDGIGTAARLNFPVGLALDDVNQFLYFTEFGNHCLRRVNLPYNSRSEPSWKVERVAGSGFYGPTLYGPNGAQGTGNGDGVGTAAVFYYPAGISFNKVDGSILLADTNNHVIRKIRIATSGQYAWQGDSAAFLGTVGVAGNRDFSDLTEFTYAWKKDALLMRDNPGALVSVISGSSTDTLSVANAQYGDAGVYALVVTNTFEDVIETTQAFVYIATAGDPPRFLSPGYRVEFRDEQDQIIDAPRKGMTVSFSADILPAEQVTYQWEVTDDVPDENGEYQWLALSDSPIGIQTLNNPSDLDTVKNAQRIRLGTLLGTTTSTVSGSTSAKLTISKLQESLTGIPPKLRFRVQAYTRALPSLPLDTKVANVTMGATWTVSPPQTVDAGTVSGLQTGMTLSGVGIAPGTKIKSILGGTLTLDTPATLDITGGLLSATLGSTTVSFTGTWTAVPEQTVTVDSASGLSVGMHLVGTGITANTKIKAIDTSNPNAVVLTLDTPVSQPGTNVQIAGADDLETGAGLAVHYPVILANPGLSTQVRGGTVQSVPSIDLVAGTQVTIALAGGTSAAQGSPAPTYQWFKKSIVSGTVSVAAIAGETSLSYTVPSTSEANRGEYFVTVYNGVGTPVNSNSVFLNVERNPTLTLLSMEVEAGTLITGTSRSTTFSATVDKTKVATVRFRANVDASAQPTYTWSFLPEGSATPITSLAGFTATEVSQLSSGTLSFAQYPDDWDGRILLNIRLPGVGSIDCSWSVVVKALPQFVGGSKVFRVGTLNITDDAYTVDLNEDVGLFLEAQFKSPRTLPITYRWRRDRSILVTGTNSLSLNRLTRQDMGSYRLEVSNAMGTLVLGAVPGSADLPFPGNPAPTGWKLAASGKPSVVVQPNGKLLTATNATIISAGFAGTVAAAPRVQAGPLAVPSVQTVQRVARGQRLALQVTVDALPPTTYQWYRALSEDPLFTKVVGATSAIYVLPPVTDPVGTRWKYYVVATNPFGEDQSEEMVVQVEGMPDPTISASAVSTPPWTEPLPFPAGSVVTLSATVTDAMAQYSYQWRVNGNPIFGATGKDLVLPNIETGQAGLYSVVATGVAGSKESAKYTVAVSPGGTVRKYSLTFQGDEEMRTVMVSPILTASGFASGTRVALSGVTPPTKMLQSWSVSYTADDNTTVSTRLPARAAQFIMPAADVTVVPILSRPYTGTYVGLLSLDVPWSPDDEWSVAEGSRGSFFRPESFVPDLGKVRGLFTCTVSSLGGVSGQIQLENKTYSFSTALDAEMRANFRIAATLKGIAWGFNGTLAFNPTDANRDQGFVDNVMHVVVRDVLLATPPLVPAGQTLYASAVGNSGAAEALNTDVQEALLSNTTAAAAAAAGQAETAPVLPAGAAAAIPGIVVTVDPPILQVGTSQAILLTARVSPPNSGPFTYQWYKGNTLSRTALSDRSLPVFGSATGTLRIVPPLSANDYGTYFVEVTNSSGAKQDSSLASVVQSLTGGGGSGVFTPGIPTSQSLPLYFTAAVYRETNGETKENSFGQAAVLSTQVRFGTGSVLVRGYLANGTRITYSTVLGRSFITPAMEGPDVISVYPGVAAALPFRPASASLAGQASEALAEVLLRRSTSQSFPLWIRGDSATSPVYGAMVFNGPRVYGSLGALGMNDANNLSEYTTNLLAGYFYDAQSPYLANLPASGLGTGLSGLLMTTPYSYPQNLQVNWPLTGSPPPTGVVQATVDRETGLLFGGLIENTSAYVRPSPYYTPAFAGGKSLLACTTAAVVIQNPNILPGFSWTPNVLGGYVGFLYRGKNAPVEPLKNVLGNGAPEAANVGGVITYRIEPLSISIYDQY